MPIRHRSCGHGLALSRLASSVPSRAVSASTHRRILTTQCDRKPWRRISSIADRLTVSRRNLATAVGDYNATDALVTNRLQRPSYPIYQTESRPKIWELSLPDPSSPLVAAEVLSAVPRQRITNNGVPGDVDEMLSIFEACLQVGKLERAALVLKRLGNVVFDARVDMAELHNRYLQAAVDQILVNPASPIAQGLHKWYELEIRGRHVEQTPETIALLLKASLLTAHGVRLERIINRYMGMVPGDEGLAVLYATDILNDQDLARITEICQTYNLNSGFEIPERLPDSITQEQVRGSEMPILEQANIPDVLGTPQKGMGLRMVKQTLSLFSEIPGGGVISNLSESEQREIQARLEQDCVDAAISRWREEHQALTKMGLNTSLSAPSLAARLYEWHRDLEARLKKEQILIDAAEAATTKSKEDLDRCIYGPFLRQSTPERLAAVTILSLLSSLSMHGAEKGVQIALVIHQLAKVAEEDIRAQRKAQESKAKGKKAAAKTKVLKPFKQYTSRIPVATSADSSTEPGSSVMFDPEDFRDASWPVTIKTKVGAALLSAVIETAKVTTVKEHAETKTFVSQLQAAFSRTYQYKKGKKIGVILPNATLVEMLKREPRSDVLARHLPMVAKPLPWTQFDKGGLLESPTALVRVKHGEKDQAIYAKAAIARGDMKQMLRGLDVLGSTAWNINTSVFDIMLEAWNSGEAIADIPALNPDITIPSEPDATDDPMLRRMWLKAVKAAENEKSGMHSVRCFMNLQMEIARALRNQTFYMPHNIDFRGRAYPMPPYLNHMGADHVRGLLCFAKGKELGEHGLRWLRVHLANVYGYDKASLSDREAFAKEHAADIVDSATNPLNGQRWWLKAEDPWQCLAACFELKAALEIEDPTKFISHIPVHQDGTCNGLQHYAALGGDTWGARQVNLEPGDKPADVYSAVAELVKESIAEDLENGSNLAKAVDGKVTRKVVKQTVMTNVYGVTFAGAKKQILKQLDDLYPTLHKTSGIEPILLASYLATKTFQALSSMFRGAHDIQYWLGEIGRRVCSSLSPEQLDRIADGTNADQSKSPKKRATDSKKASTDELLAQFRSTLVWTTPLRMPVAQPYRKGSTRVIQTCLQKFHLAVPERADPVNRRKQLQAFPPNFIHSLDASHMILSALECDELGLTFAAVHDSFWTHAADIDSMNRVLRDAFVRIHEEDVIGRLAAEFQARYGGSIYLAQVNSTTPVGKKLAAWRKENKMSMKEELLLEKQRLDLLRSSDADLVAKGKEMVTPGSLFESISRPSDLAEEEALVDMKLGNIPSAEATATLSDDTAVAIDETETGDDAYLAEASEECEGAPLDPDAFESVITTAPKKRSGRSKATISIWAPLSFPATPIKGEFDVKRLKSSKYFFS
jgi:DNA-directed RNA polymerase, mitochondrial